MFKNEVEHTIEEEKELADPLVNALIPIAKEAFSINNVGNEVTVSESTLLLGELNDILRSCEPEDEHGYNNVLMIISKLEIDSEQAFLLLDDYFESMNINKEVYRTYRNDYKTIFNCSMSDEDRISAFKRLSNVRFLGFDFNILEPCLGEDDAKMTFYKSPPESDNSIRLSKRPENGWFSRVDIFLGTEEDELVVTWDEEAGLLVNGLSNVSWGEKGDHINTVLKQLRVDSFVDGSSRVGLIKALIYFSLIVAALTTNGCDAETSPSVQEPTSVGTSVDTGSQERTYAPEVSEAVESSSAPESDLTEVVSDLEKVLENYPDAERERIEQQLKRIRDYREELGLLREIPELQEYDYSETETLEGDFVNNLPPDYQSIADIATMLFEGVAGKEYVRFIHGIRLNDLGYNGAEGGFLFVGGNIHKYTLDGVIRTYLHETGHLLDPKSRTTQDSLSFEVYLNALEGKYQALGQAFAVEGEFFNHPEDMGTKRMKRDLGILFGMMYNSSSLEDIERWFNREEIDRINEYLEEVSDSSNNIVFTKKVSDKLGGFILPMILEQPYDSPFKKIYSETMEGTKEEIWAEMFRLVLQPRAEAGGNDLEAVRANEDIVIGVARLLSEIRGDEVELDDIRVVRSYLQSIREEISNVPPGVIELFEQEEEMLSKQEEPGDEYNAEYQKFYEGVYQIPEDCPNRELVQEYMGFVSGVIDEFPMLNYAESAYHSWDYPSVKDINNYDWIYDPSGFNCWDPEVVITPQAMFRDEIVALVRALEQGGPYEEVKLLQEDYLNTQISRLEVFLNRGLHALIVRGEEDIAVNTDLLNEAQLDQVREFIRLRNRFVEVTAEAKVEENSDEFSWAWDSASPVYLDVLFKNIISGNVDEYFKMRETIDDRYWDSLPQRSRMLKEYLDNLK